MPRLFCGTFEAEAHPRQADLAKLPGMPDRNASRIVEAMDEMLFAFFAAGDTVLTARSINACARKLPAHDRVPVQPKPLRSLSTR